MSATRVLARPPTIRVCRAPRSEPPTDEELVAAGLAPPPMTAPPLPLELPGPGRRAIGRRTGTPDRQAERDGAAPVTGARAARARPARIPAGDELGPVARPVVASPARLATRRFLAICVEVLGGFRPMAQLRALCLPERFDDIAERLRDHATGRSRSAPRTPVARRAATGAPPRPGRAGQSAGDRVALRRIQVCEAVDGVAEIAAVLARRDQVWAMALRLERTQGRWLCAHLEVI